VDYLLKPFDRDRLRMALERARQRLAQPASGSAPEQVAALLADLRAREPYPARMAIRSEGRVALVRTDDIDWVEASDNYVILHVGEETHMLRETLTAFEGKLPPDRFLRISRSTIVNMDRIKELQPLFHGEYAVLLRGGARLTLSRGYRDKLKTLGLG
jgi:two-component system LytT family response regulator